MLVQLKSNPWLRVPIATLQFLWVALNNITGVFGYWCLHICALPIKCVDKQLFDTIERNLYHITFFFCSSWGFENGWKMIVSGDVRNFRILKSRKNTLFLVRKIRRAGEWKMHSRGESSKHLRHFRPDVASCNAQRAPRRCHLDYGRDFQTFEFRMGLLGSRRFLHLATGRCQAVQICCALRPGKYQRTWISREFFILFSITGSYRMREKTRAWLDAFLSSLLVFENRAVPEDRRSPGYCEASPKIVMRGTKILTYSFIFRQDLIAAVASVCSWSRWNCRRTVTHIISFLLSTWKLY